MIKRAPRMAIGEERKGTMRLGTAMIAMIHVVTVGETPLACGRRRGGVRWLHQPCAAGPVAGAHTWASPGRKGDTIIVLTSEKKTVATIHARIV